MIQLTWPHAATDWAYCLDEITATFLDLAEAITRYERLLVVTPDIAGTYQQLAQRLSVEALRQTTLFECPTNDTWARDHGALTLLANDGSQELLDFQFNGWGEKFPADLDNAINRRLADANLLGTPLSDHNDFVLEGGSVETDGCGTVFTTAQCLLAPHRNQPLTLEGIETQLKERLHARRIVWLHHGHLVGDDTDGHIDTIVRTAPDDTLLYIRCNDKRDPQHDDFQRLEKQLEELRTLDGKPYRLLPLPMPRALYDDDGERMPATYANFLVINGAVLVPTYNQTDNDQAAMRTIATAFPGRDIIGIDARQIIRQHGSIHCCTMQYPAGVF